MAAKNTGRVQPVVLAAIFLSAGMSVTFTQNLHESIAANELIFALFTAVFGVASLLFALKNKKLLIGILLAAVSAAAATTASMVAEVSSFRLVVLLWAAATAFIFLLAWVQSKTNNDLALAVLMAILAVMLLLVAHTLPTVMGLFAAVCIVAGVYVGISAFDPQTKELDENKTEVGYSA